jgi:ferredoxin
VSAVPVQVDRSRCVGSGTCVQIAADLFVLDGGTARVLAPGEPGARSVRDDDATAADVDEAVDSCPVQAIEGGRG